MKKWLTDNEIYFKTAAYVVLPLLAIVIALQANNISQNQVGIMGEQAQILKQQQLPMIYATIDLALDPKLNKFTTDTMTISNLGGPLFDLKVYPAVFFEIQYSQTNFSFNRFLIPVLDYYSADIHADAPTGKVATLVGEQNNLQAIDSQQRFASFAESQNAFGIINTSRYIEVTYVDRFNDEHLEIYYVDPISGSSIFETPPVNKSAAEELIRLHREGLLNGIAVYLSNSTPEVLLDKFNKTQEVYPQYPLLRFLGWKPPSK